MTAALLPPNATVAERALAGAAALAIDLPVEIAAVWDPARCPVALLPWLAWTFSVDEWEAGWPEDRQRAVIAASIEIHRHKGSLWSVRRALEVLGYGDCEITEGWQTMVGGPWAVGDATRVGGANHWAEYWVTIRAPITPDMVATIARRLSAVAPVRCRLTRINVDAVAVVVGGPWAAGDATVTVGATYPTAEIY